MKIGQNRRDFLKKLGLSAAALAFPGCLNANQRLSGKAAAKKR